MQKIIDKFVISKTAPENKNTVWLKQDAEGNTTMQVYNEKKASWSSSGGGAEIEALLKNGVPIVDSVEALDALDTDIGAVAVVATKGTITESSVRDLYQPTMDDVDADTVDINVANFNAVIGVALIPPTGLMSGVSTSVYFCTEGVNLADGATGATAMIGFSASDAGETAGKITRVTGITADMAAQARTEYTFFDVADDGVVTTNQDQIDAFMAFLSGYEFYYLGFFENMMFGTTTTEEEFATVDLFVKTLFKTASVAHIYFKKDAWEELYAEDFAALRNDVAELYNLYGILYGIIESNEKVAAAALNDLKIKIDELKTA